MSKLRLRFVKEGPAVYLSHLDLLRTFQRVFLRAGIALRHSQGFHPHPLLTLALPLPLGQASSCEVLDFETNSEEDAAALPERLSAVMPAGIRAVDCWMPEKPLRELALLQAEVTFCYDQGTPPACWQGLDALWGRESLIIQKRTKRKALVDVDLRPMLRETVPVREAREELTFRVTVQAQEPGLNTALLAEAVRLYAPALAPDFVRVRRLALLDKTGKAFR